MKCFECQKQGLKSTVYPGACTRTCMSGSQYWDENGVYHYNDPNYTTTAMRCSNGHEWIDEVGPPNPSIEKPNQTKGKEMFTVSINGTEKEIEAKGLTIEGGSILFFCDVEKGLVDQVIASGKWDYLKVGRNSDPLQINRGTQAPVQTEAESSKEAQQAEEGENQEKESKEKNTQPK